MSDKERPRDDDSGGGGDDEDGDEPTKTGDPHEKKCNGCGKKGKIGSIFRMRKNKKVPNKKRKQKGISVNSRWWVCGGGGDCCLTQPRTVDSSGESPTSDPNSKEFGFDMLRALIENNDFYSKECNPHLDASYDDDDYGLVINGSIEKSE